MEPFRVHRFSSKALLKTQVVAVVKANFSDKHWLKWLALFLSSTTLLCCALPVLLVSLGLGAVMANLNYNVPGLLFLTEHKSWTLSLSFLLLCFLAWIIWRPNQTCPTDPVLAELCTKTKRWNRRVFKLSVVIWITALFFSYLLLPIRQFFEQGV